jgi:hypothetical protein
MLENIFTQRGDAQTFNLVLNVAHVLLDTMEDIKKV